MENQSKEISFTLPGVIPSKKNAWKRSGSGSVFIKDGVKSDLDAALWELKSIKNRLGLSKPLEGLLRVEATFQVPKLDYDLDNAYTSLQDLLQGAGIIKNDRQIEGFTVDVVKGTQTHLTNVCITCL